MEHKLRLVQGGTPLVDRRTAERRQLGLPGQLVWKDARGTTRMLSVVTRDASDLGVAVECLQGPAIPLYRMVYFQIDRSVRDRADLPAALRKANILSAVFRVGACDPRTGTPNQYGLRLLVEPARKKAAGRTAWQEDDAKTMTA